MSRIPHALHPHSHDAADKVDAAMEASGQGMRVLWVSASILAATALLQAAVVAMSGSVALLSDTLHNAIDALSVVPLAIAFVAGRRPPTRRYTYGYGRAEDLAGVVIVILIAASAAATTWVAASRLTHPHRVSGLGAVAVAAVVGFAGNELVARYRVNAGRRIGSAALVADGLHARTDGLASLAVLLGVGGSALGWQWADPVVGLLITLAILAVLRRAAVQIWHRLMDAVDPDLLDQAEQALSGTPGVLGIGQLRLRWVPPTAGRVRGDGRRRCQRGRGTPGGRRRGARAPACRAAPADGAGARRPAARRRHRLPRGPGFTSPSLTAAGQHRAWSSRTNTTRRSTSSFSAGVVSRSGYPAEVRVCVRARGRRRRRMP